MSERDKSGESFVLPTNESNVSAAEGQAQLQTSVADEKKDKENAHPGFESEGTMTPLVSDEVFSNLRSKNDQIKLQKAVGALKLFISKVGLGIFLSHLLFLDSREWYI
jgi:hypothetical protein